MNQTDNNENAIVALINQSGLESKTSMALKERFMEFFDQADEWERKARELKVTDVTQVDEMKKAREARLALKNIRVNADKTRKLLKEDSLRYGKAVQGIYNVIEYKIAPIEKYLEEQERFAEIQEAKKREELKVERERIASDYHEFIPYGIDFSALTEEDFNKMINGAKMQIEERERTKKKIEEERVAREKAEAEERERIRLENERLKAEAEAREKQIAEERAKAEAERKAVEEKLKQAQAERERQLAEERAKAEAIKKEAEEKARKEREASELKLKQEREAKERAEAELKAKAEAEARAKREAEEKQKAEQQAKELAEKRAKAAPDKFKLLEISKMIETIPFPELSTSEGNEILLEVRNQLTKTSKYIRDKTLQM